MFNSAHNFPFSLSHVDLSDAVNGPHWRFIFTTSTTEADGTPFGGGLVYASKYRLAAYPPLGLSSVDSCDRQVPVRS